MGTAFLPRSEKGDSELITSVVLVSMIVSLILVAFLFSRYVLDEFIASGGSDIERELAKDSLELLAVEMLDSNTVSKVFIRNAGENIAEDLELFISSARACTLSSLASEAVYDFNSTNCPDITTVVVNDNSSVRLSSKNGLVESTISALK